jgi:hypothetical protein
MTEEKFPSWPSIPRLMKLCFYTEKLDGTNGLVRVRDGVVRAGSRNRWLTPEDDNFGFAKWVKENEQELLKLGEGDHHGEWVGKGIQRGYGLSDKRFYLFNVGKWSKHVVMKFATDDPRKFRETELCPKCCDVVPLLAYDTFGLATTMSVMRGLSEDGSCINPDFKNPEGIVIYHTAASQFFKYTFNGDRK